MQIRFTELDARFVTSNRLLDRINNALLSHIIHVSIHISKAWGRLSHSVKSTRNAIATAVSSPKW